MISVGSVLWNASVTLIKNKDVHYVSQLSVRASRSNENNVCREGSKWESFAAEETWLGWHCDDFFLLKFGIDVIRSIFLYYLKFWHFYFEKRKKRIYFYNI